MKNLLGCHDPILVLSQGQSLPGTLVEWTDAALVFRCDAPFRPGCMEVEKGEVICLPWHRIEAVHLVDLAARL
jgi:hypothetical protein